MSFSGFVVSSHDLQQSINSMNYDQEGVVSEILDRYSDALEGLITGLAPPAHTEDINKLASLMAGAASKGNYMGVAISCFCRQGEDFENHLPIPLNKMDEDSRYFFVLLLRSFGGIGRGFSKSGTKYLSDNKQYAEKLAEDNYPEMQYLMGFWYSFDDIDHIGEEQCITNRRDWYEKAALGGYQPAFFDAGSLFDRSKDFGKAAYWFYQGCQVEDISSCYSLGVMYALGGFVKRDLKAASFYLSLVYRNAHKIPKFAHFEQQAKTYLEESGIAIQSPPYIHGDKELDPNTSELSNIYHNQSLEKENIDEDFEQMKKLEDYLFKIFTEKSDKFKQSGAMDQYWFQQGMIASLKGDVDTAWMHMLAASNLGQIRARSLIENGENKPRKIIIVDHLSYYGDQVNQAHFKELKENIPWYEQQLKEVHRLLAINNQEEAVKILKEMVEHDSYQAYILLKSRNGYFN